MTNLDAQSGFIGELLQLVLPPSGSIVIATSRIGRDQQFRGWGIGRLAHTFPPVANGVDRKFGGVVINAYADPSLVAGDVVDAMRRHFALLLVFKIVHANRFGLALPVPLSASVFEIAHQLLFLAINGNDGLVAFLKVLAQSVDVLELRVAISMRGSFAGLAQPLHPI